MAYPGAAEPWGRRRARSRLRPRTARGPPYSAFTRDQNYLEANIDRLRTPVKVVWGERDVYIDKAMAIEFAERIGADLTLLAGIGHFPHL